MNKVSIITIGDELLIGQVIDTNSAWMAQALNKAGFDVVRRVAVGDEKDTIVQALNQESALADIVLITGGLGPTADDITKPLLCAYFGGKMVTNEAALKNVTYLFEKIFKKSVTERNITQALVPDCCTVIQNKRGTAPGMWFEKEGKIYVSMPGVPHEMQGMMQDEVIPSLIKHCKAGTVLHKTLITFGIGESFLADLVQDFEQKLPGNIKLAYLPHFGMVRLRLTAKTEQTDTQKESIETEFEKLKAIVNEYLIADEDIPMEKIVGNLLVAENKTVCTAESCTGGLVAHLLTSVPGSSAYMQGGIVSYSNEVKTNFLQVSNEILSEHGAVSEETVTQMVTGALSAFKTDYAIAVSGIMGPDGGSEDKPVGAVWIGVGNKEKISSRKYHFRFDRKRNTELTAMNALNQLREFISKQQL